MVVIHNSRHIVIPPMTGLRVHTPRGGASVPIMYVQSALDTSGSSSCAFASNNTAGNFLIVAVRWATGTTFASSVTDTNGNTYVRFGGTTNLGGGGYKAELFYAHNCAAGANTVTVAWTAGTPVGLQIAVHEYSGIALTAALDTFKSSSGSGTSADTGATSAISQANELLFGYVWSNATVTGQSIHADYTQRQAYAATGFVTADRVVSAVGTYNFTSSWTTSRTFGIYVFAFKGITPG